MEVSISPGSTGLRGLCNDLQEEASQWRPRQPSCRALEQSPGRALSLVSLRAHHPLKESKGQAELSMPSVTWSVLQSERPLLCLGRRKERSKGITYSELPTKEGGP